MQILREDYPRRPDGYQIVAIKRLYSMRTTNFAEVYQKSCGLEVQSEIVVPVFKNNKFVAELDIDSHSPAPFTPEDSVFLGEVCELLVDCF